MRRLALALAAVVIAAADSAAVGAQTSAAPPPETLTGCVQQVKADDGSSHFVLADPTKSGIYELTGKNMRPFLDKRVEVSGTVKRESPNRLHISGGLTPTPNVAAQAGAIDPATAANAALPGGGPKGTPAELAQEFKSGNAVAFNVGRVSTAQGNCK